jgi:metal-sulfur cluster biosynthetic enzyme
MPFKRGSNAAPSDPRTKVLFSEETVREKLREVVDPELGLNVVDLGLIYGVEMEDSTVRVTYTLTSPACPLGPLIAGAMQRSVSEIPGVGAVELKLTFSPPWDPKTMASEEARMEMGIW